MSNFPSAGRVARNDLPVQYSPNRLPAGRAFPFDASRRGSDSASDSFRERDVIVKDPIREEALRRLAIRGARDEGCEQPGCDPQSEPPADTRRLAPPARGGVSITGRL